MKKTLSGLILFSIASFYAQVKFEKGYIIDQNNVKKEVLIKNKGWVSNPDNFVFKTDENSAEDKGTPSTIKEFGIYNDSKYVTYNGNIDYSSDDISSFSNTKEPKFVKSSVFLKELVAGNKNLYTYKGHITRYFYSESDSTIQPLIYKKYFFNGNSSQVATNEQYLDQLKTIFADNTNAQSLVNKTQYTASSLTKIFKTYNGENSDGSTAQNSDQSFTETKKKPKFNLSIRPGINFYAPLELKESYRNPGFPSKSNFRIGVEAELVLPFNKNKWSVILEPTYAQYTNKKTTIRTDDNLYNMTMDSYSFISIPVGIRYSMFLNEKSKIFVNVATNVLNVRTSSSASIDVDYDNAVFDKIALASTQSFRGMSLGAGFNYHNKFSVEARFSSSTNILYKDLPHADLKSFSLILGYNIF
ncbi:PorT family protein [Chryseobacterium sp. MEBOG06]|uniref:outer membrane beta-barrel protein n=1 Tax=Chryseobacterium sp. MEBOG06 TaxID=2879938 RepID=UPI001F3E4DDC|nr:outer membrane beta-barrel protein [Chryseobacterium sp. MEBOG06]UKB83043.1 PorT family protein [Chryseobacterium sp. MEBOG06]